MDVLEDLKHLGAIGDVEEEQKIETEPVSTAVSNEELVELRRRVAEAKLCLNEAKSLVENLTSILAEAEKLLTPTERSAVAPETEALRPRGRTKVAVVYDDNLSDWSLNGGGS